MEKIETYIITFEDGEQYISNEILRTDEILVEQGVISVIRISDLKELNMNGKWCELRKWQH